MTEQKFKLQVKQSDIDRFNEILENKSSMFDTVSINGIKYVIQTIGNESERGVSIFPRLYATEHSFKDGLQMYSDRLSIGELKYQALKWLVENDTLYFSNQIEYEIVDEPIKPKLTFKLLSKYTANSSYGSKTYPNCCKNCSSIISCKKLFLVGREPWVDFACCDKCKTFLAIIVPDQQACEGQGRYDIEEYSYDFIKDNFTF